jgi:hypothetical protein
MYRRDLRDTDADDLLADADDLLADAATAEQSALEDGNPLRLPEVVYPRHEKGHQ